MKIVIATGIYPPEVGGPPIFVREFARILHTSGAAEPVVVTYGDEMTQPGDGWLVIPVSRNGGAMIRYIRYAWRVFCEARRADVVFVQGAVSEGFPGTIGALLAGKKTVMRVPGDYAWEQYQQTPGETHEFLDEFVTHRHQGAIRVMEEIERWTSRRAARVIACSRYIHGIVKAWGVEEKNIRTIYSNTTPFSPTLSRDELRQQSGCSDKTVIFTVARAVPWKGVDFLMDVLQRLPEEFMLIVAGDGPLLKDLQGQVISKGLSQRCRLLGRVSHDVVGEWLVAADLFVLASAYEGFPHVVVEAITKGLPCLVSDRGGNPETKELFPEHVRVLPYRDLEAWVEACRTPHARLREIPPRDFLTVGLETLGVLKEVCVS